MASDSLKIELDVETRQAVQGLAAVARGLKSAEDGAGEAGSAFGRFTAGMRAGSDTAERYYANVARGAGVLAGLTRSVIDGTAAHERNERALRTLGGAYADVAQQTQGAFTAAEALRAQQGLVQSGLQISNAELGVAARAAREYALATGTEATAALEQLTDALRGGEAEGLRRFGVTLEANTTRSQAFRSALTQLESAQRGLAPSSQTMAEANAELGRTWDQLTGQLASNIAQWTNLRETMSGALAIMREVSESGLGTFTGDTAAARDNRASSNDLEARLTRRNNYQNALTRARGRLGGEDLQFARADMGLNAAQQVALTERISRATTVEQLREIADDSRWMHDGNVGARARVAAASAARVAAEPAARDAANARSDARGSSSPAQYDAARFEMVDTINELFRSMLAGGLGSPTDRRATYGSSYGELADLAGAQLGQLSGFGMRSVARRPGESTQDYLARTSTAANDFVTTRNSDRAEMAQGLRSKEIAENERAAALADALRESELAKAREQDTQNSNAMGRARAQSRRENPGAQLRDAFLPAALETQTAAEKMAEGVSGAFATMTGAVKSHVAALIEGRETAGQAMLGIAHDTLLALATEAVGRSLMSLGGALAATAIGSPTAPLLYASAAAYAGVAALAGAGAAATGAAMAGAAPAASAASRTPPAAASAGSSGRGAGGGTAITINVNGTVMDREGTADSIRELLNDSLSRGGVLRAA